MKEGLNLISNKKGNIIMDSAVIGLVLFILAIFSIVGGHMFDTLNSDIQTNPDVQEIGRNISGNLHDRYYLTMDSAFVVVFIIFWIILLVSAFNINSNPVFFGVMSIVMLFVILAGAFFSNTYEEFSSEEEYISSASNFTIQNFIMNNFFVVILVVAFSVLMVMYMKTKMT